jgi:HK97 family phage portal protein
MPRKGVRKVSAFDWLFRRRGARDALGVDQYSWLLGGSTTSAGVSVDERTAMQTTAVYACVRILAETIASLPLHVYKYTENGSEKAVDHPLYSILRDEPNPEMTAFAFRETLMTHLLLWGNAYSQIIRDGRGRVIGLYPLMPNKIVVNRAENGALYYTYRRDAGESRLNPEYDTILLNYEDVLHVPGLGFDGLIGYSPIAMAKNAIGMSMAAEEFGATFFGNGARPGGILEHPGVVKDIKRLKDSWNAAYQGSKNSNRVAILEEGMKYTPIGIPPEAAQFLQTRKFQTEEICRIFRVPPHLVADLDKATFSNIEHQSIDFVVHTVRPWLVRLEQGFNKALLSRAEKKLYFTSFTVDGLLRGAYAERMRGYSIGLQNGFLSPNDIRNLENMNKIQDGNTYMVNGNMTKLADVGAAYGGQAQTTPNIGGE